MTPRTTQSTIQALERLTDALGWELGRDGRQFVVRYPRMPDDLTPVSKTSARALALLVSSVQHRDDWPELQAAAAFNPGWTRVRLGGVTYTVPDIPDMIAWEEEALATLAEPYRPGDPR